MGCGTSHNVGVRDHRAYHGVAVAPVVSPVSPVNGEFTTQAVAHPWETHTSADKKAGDDFYFGVNEALQRRMRRQRIAEWRNTTLGIVREKQRGPAQKPRYDHLTKFGTCQLGMVDELSTCAHVGEAASMSDGATHSSDRSCPSSLSTSGCTTFANHASIRIEPNPPKSTHHDSMAERLNVSVGPHVGSAPGVSLHTNPFASLHSCDAAASRATHPLRDYTLHPCNNGHAHRVKLVLVVPQGDIVLSCSTVDRHVLAYHLHLQTEVGRLVGHDDVILGGAVSPDGRLVATASRDCSAILWELPSCKQRRSLTHPAAVHACRFSATGMEVATACADGLCRLWTWSDTDVVHTLVSVTTGFDGALTSLTYSFGDRHLVAAGPDNAVFVWDRQRFGDAGTVFRQHRSTVLSVDASHTMQGVVVSADERSVHVWNCETLEPFYCVRVDQCCVPRGGPRRRVPEATATAAAPHSFYWTAVRLVELRVGVFVVAAASDKCVHLFPIPSAAGAAGGVTAVLSLPFSSSLSCVDGGPSNLVALGDTCGNRHILTLM